MENIKKILLENKAWAEGHRDIDPDYFSKMNIDQKPEYLWIGCSDSRVMPTEMTNTRPGEMFIHRNIANLVLEDDLNLMAILEFAVDVLGINYIIVCGHYSCGGIRAALSGIEKPKVKAWISSITEQNKQLKLNDVDKLAEANVINQISKLKKMDLIQRHWDKRRKPILLGWIYDMNTGMIKVLAQESLPGAI
jgi:carbonic anhydrase